jgi:soluble lytic murein transglycosylase-like protein
MSDAVLTWAGQAKAAEKETGVPTAVLLGLISVESQGIEGRTSRTGAGGLTQFEPRTAAEYHVDVSPGHASSQIFGAARYLKALGWDKDPAGALAKYNGGPGNPQPSYAAKVLAAAKRYGNVNVPAATSPQAQPASSGGGSDVFASLGDNALHALLWAALAIAGATLIGLGTARASGLRQPHGTIA